MTHLTTPDKCWHVVSSHYWSWPSPVAKQTARSARRLTLEPLRSLQTGWSSVLHISSSSQNMRKSRAFEGMLKEMKGCWNSQQRGQWGVDSSWTLSGDVYEMAQKSFHSPGLISASFTSRTLLSETHILHRSQKIALGIVLTWWYASYHLLASNCPHPSHPAILQLHVPTDTIPIPVSSMLLLQICSQLKKNKFYTVGKIWGPPRKYLGEPQCAMSWSLRTMGPEPNVAKTVSPASFQRTHPNSYWLGT